jgi:citrate synthase
MTVNNGLEGVIAADTVLSHTDGNTGTIWVRGHTIDDLVANHGFEGTVAIIWEGFAGKALTREAITREFGASRLRAFAAMNDWLGAAAKRPLLEGVRVALAALPEDSKPADIHAALPVATAALIRLRDGKSAVKPDPALSTAADFLRMLRGAPASANEVRALDTYLTTVCENGLGNSSFAARVTVSTRASLVSAVVSAYCAFTGPLHGGAPGPVLDMLDAIGAPERARAWLAAELEAGRRIMGMGHRVYRVRDPRAEVLERAIEALAASGGGGERLALARAVEKSALALLAERHPARALRANVEFYTAVLLDALGVDRRLFTPTFAVGRVIGWYAHVAEQRRSGRLIRPQSRYVGPAVAG